MNTLVPTLAGIAWDPEIRGILSVLVGVVVLAGSVYLLLGTNVGNRLGVLLSLPAIFGWMTIHGLVWVIYPPIMGPAGRGPSWEIQEVVYGDLAESMLEEAHHVDTSTLPPPDEVDDLTPEEVAVVTDEHADELNEWSLLAASDASRGEAQTAVDAVLAEGIVPGLEDSTSRVFTYTFETGGKPQRDSDSVIDRVSNRVSNTLRLTHPPHYAIVQMQPATVARLAAQAVSLFPVLDRVQLMRVYRGYRPYCPDHLPVIGPDPRVPGVIHACGHEGAGIGLAPATAELVAAHLTGTDPRASVGVDPAPFLPDRFLTETEVA